MYRPLLELCGYTAEESVTLGPRFARALERWGYGSEELGLAEVRVRRFYDLKLAGVRRFLSIWLKEFTDLTLAKDDGKKVIYFSFPPVGQLASALAVSSDDIYSGMPETTIMAVVGGIFGRLNPILEEAEKVWLPRGQAHCAIPEIRLAAIMHGQIPVPDLLIATGTTCDQVGKTDELLEALRGTRVTHVDGSFATVDPPPPHVEPARITYMAGELRKVANDIREVTGHDITEDTMSRGRQAFRGVRALYSEIQQMLAADPIPLSHKDFGMIGLTTTSYLRTLIREGPSAAHILVGELKERVKRGEGVLPRGAPRVLIQYPHFSDPEVTEVIENCGLAIAASARSQTLDQAPLRYEDAWERAAELTLRAGGSVTGTVNVLKDLARQWQVDGVIINTISVCRYFNLYPLRAKQVIEKDLGIPVLAIEHDPYDSRDYTPQQFRSRVEPFAEMLRARKGA